MNTKHTPFTLAISLLLLFSVFISLGGLSVARGASPLSQSATMNAPLLIVRAGPPGKAPHYVPPPREFLRNAPHTASITVNYIGTWDSQAQAAFQYAVDIWETQLTSSIPITVDAEWTALPSGVLGSAGATSLYRNFSGAPMSDTWYPVALAEKLANSDLNGGVAEIHAQFNSAFSSWYFGTDGNTPSDKYDFASVVLHELGHGLGFFGSMIVDDGDSSNGDECTGTANVGCWGNGSGFPFVYDQFTENGSGAALLSFPQNSLELGAQLTSNDVFFDGPNTNAANSSQPAELYAPPSWQYGSSYSHLGEIFNGTENALMTYSLSPGEANHDPGPVMRGMFADMGWTINGATATPSPTWTTVPTDTPTPTWTPVPTDTFTPTWTPVPTDTPTFTPGPSPTPAPAQGAYLPVVLNNYAIQSPTATPIPVPSGWLGYFNDLRARGGLPALSENATWSSGCTLHARYMVKTDTITHAEDPASPWYTAEGDAAAGNSNLMVSSDVNASDESAFDLWMTGPFHGIGLIDPNLSATGFGSYREATGTWRMGACVDVWSGWTGVPDTVTFPILWPGDGETMPYTSFDGSEMPDPLSSCGYTAPSGPPVYLLLGPGWSTVPNVTASSFKQGNTELPHCVFDETSYTNPDSDLQDLGRSILDARDAVVLMPQAPLTPGAGYTVSITVSGQTYTWSFTVSDTPRFPARLAGETLMR